MSVLRVGQVRVISEGSQFLPPPYQPLPQMNITGFLYASVFMQGVGSCKSLREVLICEYMLQEIYVCSKGKLDSSDFRGGVKFATPISPPVL